MTNLNNPFDLFSLLDDDIKKAEETIQDVPAVTSELSTTESDNTNKPILELDEKIPDESTASIDTKTDENNCELNMIEQISQKADTEEAAKKQELEEKQTTKKTSNLPSKNDKNTFAVNESTIIRYYRELIPLTNYFTVEEIIEGVSHKKADGTLEYKKIDAEMVRARLEKDFPEFVKGHTEMIYHGGKRNFIIPSVIAKKKGNIDLSEQEVSSSKDDTSFPFPNKIPFHLLEEFISIAKAFGTLQLEVRAEIYYNFDTELFMLHVPKQTVHKYWVLNDEPTGYFQKVMLDEHEQYVQLACEIHSHHIMSPRPSEVDNESERQPGMYYVIVGNTNSEIPSVHCRTFSIHHEHILKSENDLFEDLDSYSELPKWDIKDITIK